MCYRFRIISEIISNNVFSSRETKTPAIRMNKKMVNAVVTFSSCFSAFKKDGREVNMAELRNSTGKADQSLGNLLITLRCKDWVLANKCLNVKALSYLWLTLMFLFTDSL